MANMTFDKYIDNPSGGQAFTNRQIYKQLYQRKFDALMVRERGIVNYKIYKANDTSDAYFIHFKIPSEVVEKFYYDVVIRLYTVGNDRKNDANLRNYFVNFYSNDPAFVYTFAYSFRKNKLFITDLEPKMSKKALRERAEIRNPDNQVWYVKSLFFAYLAMEKYHLFTRSMLNQNSEKYDKKKLMSNIMNADDKVAARQHEADLINQQKKKEKEEARKELLKKAHMSPLPKHNSKVAKVSKVSKTTKTSKVSRTSRISKRTKIT